MSLMQVAARGKGNRLTRQVPSLEGEGRPRQTILQLQTYRLSSALKGAFTESDKLRYMGYVLTLDQARYMNMEVAAKVLLFMARNQLFVDNNDQLLKNLNNNLTQKNMSDYITQALALLKVDRSKYSEDDYKTIVLRTEAIFARYIRYIISVKVDNNLQFNDMTIPEGLKIQKNNEFTFDVQL